VAVSNRLDKRRAVATRLAHTDTLTGLGNRRAFDEALDREWNRAIRYREPISLALLDIDHFKRFNDHYGHKPGDECLAKVGHLLSETVFRPGDMIARYGGEEFAIFLSGSDGKSAMKLANRLRTGIEKTPFYVGDSQINITISLGVAEYNENSPNLETLVARADQALYVAKHKGRNRVILGT
jgi:diguanylate cyclase (GGDEF)-like protein